MAIHWDLATGAVLHRYEINEYTPIPVEQMAVSPDGTLLLIGDNSGGLYLFDVDTGKERQRFVAHVPTEVMYEASFSPDGRTVYSVGRVGDHELETLVVWDVETGQEIRRFEVGDVDTLTGLRIGPTDLAATVSPDGQRALGGGATIWYSTM
jgi:WD40 repeat protein